MVGLRWVLRVAKRDSTLGPEGQACRLRRQQAQDFAIGLPCFAGLPAEPPTVRRFPVGTRITGGEATLTANQVDIRAGMMPEVPTDVSRHQPL